MHEMVNRAREQCVTKLVEEMKFIVAKTEWSFFFLKAYSLLHNYYYYFFLLSRTLKGSWKKTSKGKLIGSACKWESHQCHGYTVAI